MKNRTIEQTKKLKLFCWDRLWKAKNIRYRVFWLRQFNSLHIVDVLK